MKRKAILALTLAGLVALQMPMTSFASTAVHLHNGSQTGANENGDIVATDDNPAVAAMDGVNCVVKNVTAQDAVAIGAQSGAAVTADSATNTADNQSTVVAWGKTGETDPAKQTKVTVNDAVTNNGAGSAIAAYLGAAVTAGSAENTSDICFTVSANGTGTEVTVTDGVTNNGTSAAIYAQGGAKVTAGSAESTSNDCATVNANGTGTEVNVTDGVKNNGTNAAIYAEAGAAVTAGSVDSAGSGISAKGLGTVVTVDDDVKNTGVRVEKINANSGKYAAITATENAVVNAGGDVTADNSNLSYAVEANNAKVTVDGTVTDNCGAGAVRALNNAVVVAGSAVNNCEAGTTSNWAVFANNSTVVIQGDVTNNTNMSAVGANGTSKVVVEGTVESNYAGPAVSTNGSGQVFAYAIKNNNTDNTRLTYGNVHYLVRTLGSTDAIEIQSGVKTTEAIADKTYEYADEGDTIVFSLKEGYDLDSPLAARNADGTYTILVPAGGGVSIEAIKKAIEEAEQRAAFTGTIDNAVSGGQWNTAPDGSWSYSANGTFKDTWGYITLADGRTGWFWFDGYGIMATGWKTIGGKMYYFNEAHDGTYGMMLADTTTPDGYRVGADGARIQ